MKLRLGRADPRDDLATIKAVRDAIGDDIDLMVDFNQALNLADALRRCHMIDDLGLVVDRGTGRSTTISTAAPASPPN